MATVQVTGGDITDLVAENIIWLLGHLKGKSSLEF